ncbi:MAG: NUDIX hydrolase [Chloroflexi bacterium]|nr:NUDIX hydrolase [Chloroflexota bacterium]
MAREHERAHPWEVLGTEYLLKSPWRHVRQDQVRLHTGDEIVYTYLETTDAAFVVPLTTDGKVVVIRQFRLPARAWTWEVVGGMIAAGEPPIAAAERELREEVGGVGGRLVPLGSYYACAGSLSSRHHAFLGLDVELVDPALEPMELIERVLLDPDDAFARARDGRIDDAQSALALLMAEPHIRAHLAQRNDP